MLRVSAVDCCCRAREESAWARWIEARAAIIPGRFVLNASMMVSCPHALLPRLFFFWAAPHLFLLFLFRNAVPLLASFSNGVCLSHKFILLVLSGVDPLDIEVADKYHLAYIQYTWYRTRTFAYLLIYSTRT